MSFIDWCKDEGGKTWKGYSIIEDTFMGREYVLVLPKEGTANGKWILKTEYFNAFPEVEIAFLEKGWHVAHIHNVSRWCPDEVTDTQAAFVGQIHKTYGLCEKCVPVGMSCGGMQAIFLGAKYPETISCMFIDAPVVNLLSCPFGLGNKKTPSMVDEFIQHRKMDKIQMLSFRHHPLDYLPQLVENKIPTIMVVGDSDTVVPYEENGLLLKEAYEKAGNILETYIVPGKDHHPHCMEDNTPIIHFIEKYSK